MNPFTARSIIKDPELFSGRHEELQLIKNLLLTLQSCSVVGPRRIGKSSLLYHLSHPSYYTEEYPSEYRFVFLDLQELSGATVEDFFVTVINRLRRISPELITIDVRKDATMSGFRRLLGDISDSGAKLVLCLDEFEMLSQNLNFAADFFTFLRGLCSNYNFALVTSSRKSLFDLCHQRDLQTSQLWNIFVELPLGLMKLNEIQNMVSKYLERGNLSMQSENIDRALTLSGNHPFFVQIGFYFLFEAYLHQQVIDFNAIHESFMNESKRHFIYTWDQLSKEHQQTLIKLQQNPGPIQISSFQMLRREALLQGSAEQPTFASDGFREFIETQIVGYAAKSAISTATDAESLSSSGQSQKPELKASGIFVSYRRSDSADITGRIYDRLVGRFGKDLIFKDVDSIPLGLDFVKYLDMKVGECDVLLAIIGDHWLDAKDDAGRNRLDDPADFVRIEIQSALDRNIPVIPLLVRDARMPREDDLPPKLRELVYRNGTPIRTDPDFHRDMDRLIAALERLLR